MDAIVEKPLLGAVLPAAEHEAATGWTGLPPALRQAALDVLSRLVGASLSGAVGRGEARHEPADAGELSDVSPVAGEAA